MNAETLPWRARLDAYYRLVRLDRPIGIYLLLWPAMWALWIAAEGRPGWLVLAVFVAGTVLMRSAGCAINDYADRHIDGEVERTRLRPLAAGEVHPREAVLIFLLLAGAAFGLVLLMNPLTIAHSFVAAGLAALYPFTKRYTQMPQFFLGLAFGWAVPMAFAAVQAQIPPVAWVIFAATLCWALAYDTIYAMVDRDDDLRIGVKSTAILFGSWDRVMVALFQLSVLTLLLLAGLMSGRGDLFWLGLILGAGLFGYQQWLIRERQRTACFRAFLNNHWFGLVVFAGLALDYLVP